MIEINKNQIWKEELKRAKKQTTPELQNGAQWIGKKDFVLTDFYTMIFDGSVQCKAVWYNTMQLLDCIVEPFSDLKFKISL